MQTTISAVQTLRRAKRLFLVREQLGQLFYTTRLREHADDCLSCSDAGTRETSFWFVNSWDNCSTLVACVSMQTTVSAVQMLRRAKRLFLIREQLGQLLFFVRYLPS